MKRVLFCIGLLFIQTFFVFSLPQIREENAGKDALVEYPMLMRPPSKEQQNKWSDELGLVTEKQRGPIEYNLDGKSEKTFTSKWIGTEEEDVIGEGNCLWRVFSYWITGNQHNYMKIREAVAKFMRENNEIIEAVKKSPIKSVDNYIQRAGLTVDACGHCDHEMVQYVAIRFKVHIYFLKSPPNQIPQWLHFEPIEKPLPKDKYWSIMFRWTGDHNRIIKDVYNSPNGMPTTPNRWNACGFKAEIYYSEENYKAGYMRNSEPIPLIVNPETVDVKKVEHLLTTNPHNRLMRGKLTLYKKTGKDEKIPIRCFGKLSEEPYNFKCGTDETIIGILAN